jgi:hypothetical protein
VGAVSAARTRNKNPVRDRYAQLHFSGCSIQFALYFSSSFKTASFLCSLAMSKRISVELGADTGVGFVLEEQFNCIRSAILDSGNQRSSSAT